MKIPFYKPYLTGNELTYIEQAWRNGKLSGDGAFTKKCQEWLCESVGCLKALLTQSGTAALEMAAILMDFQPGDEFIVPSYTFVSSVNALVLRGGVPVFVDIRADTINLDETLIEAAITPQTKAIVVVHYAGVGCDMNKIMEIAHRHGLWVIEDAAHGILSKWQGKPLGGLGHLAALSFHDTKNIISGEGGALLINDPQFLSRAEVIREKGTDRSRFLRGEVDKYTWIDIGSSFLPSEITAAFLWAQLECAEEITQRRLSIWQTYHAAFDSLEKKGKFKRPIIPSDCAHNAHMYYLVHETPEQATYFIDQLKQKNIQAVRHYVPLHDSPGGKKYGRSEGNYSITDHMADCLVRLPLWIGMEADGVLERIMSEIQNA